MPTTEPVETACQTVIQARKRGRPSPPVSPRRLGLQLRLDLALVLGPCGTHLGRAGQGVLPTEYRARPAAGTQDENGRRRPSLGYLVLGGHVFALGEHGYRIYRLPVLTLEPTKLPRPLKNDVVPLRLRMALPANEPRAS